MLCKQELLDVACALAVALVRCNDPYSTPGSKPALPLGWQLILSQAVLLRQVATGFQIMSCIF